MASNATNPTKCDEEPDIWLQHYEYEGETDDGGVRLVSYNKDGEGDDGPAVYLSPLYRAAPALADACRAVVDNWEHGDLAAAARQCAEALKKAGVSDE